VAEGHDNYSDHAGGPQATTIPAYAGKFTDSLQTTRPRQPARSELHARLPPVTGPATSLNPVSGPFLGTHPNPPPGIVIKPCCRGELAANDARGGIFDVTGQRLSLAAWRRQDGGGGQGR